MVSFWVASWEHIVFEELSPDREGNIPVISHLCFGPLETREYGITADKKYYYAEHIIEGIDAGDKVFEIIDIGDFLRALDREAALCEEYAPLLADIREKIGKGELP